MEKLRKGDKVVALMSLQHRQKGDEGIVVRANLDASLINWSGKEWWSVNCTFQLVEKAEND